MTGLEGIDKAAANGNMNNYIPEFDEPRAEYFDRVQTYWMGQKPVEKTVEVKFEDPIYGD